MIYGINFNGLLIPNRIGRKFAKEIRLGAKPHIRKAVLQGVCNRTEEQNAMLLQAQTPTRKLHFTAPRKIGGERWIGVYCYSVKVDVSEGIGWPCHSFIREPIYRKISLSKEIRLTDKGITLRQRTIREGLYRVTELSWEQLFRKRGKRKII